MVNSTFGEGGGEGEGWAHGLFSIDDFMDVECEENQNQYNLSYDLSHLLTKQESSTLIMAPREGAEGGATNPNKQGRSFGEEIDTNNNFIPIDTSFLSLESKDTVVTNITAEESTVTSALSDCATESSSVANLRGWLNDFGNQSKKHYEKTTHVGTAPSDVNLKMQTRPKVQQRHNSSTSQSKPQTAPPSVTSRPVPVRRNFPTPITIKTKVEDNLEVQATNDGYASVKKLSAWLESDPTSKKKVKQIRRGANVLAKSRKFDKGLSGIIVEQNHIRTGNVLDKKNQFQQAMSVAGSSADEEDEYDGGSYCSDERNWKGGGKSRSIVGLGSSNSVCGKRDWPVSAIKRSDTTTGSKGHFAARAKSDFVTSQDRQDDVTSRAKQMWRQRSPPRPTLLSTTPTMPRLDSIPRTAPVATYNSPTREALSESDTKTTTTTTILKTPLKQLDSISSIKMSPKRESPTVATGKMTPKRVKQTEDSPTKPSFMRSDSEDQLRDAVKLTPVRKIAFKEVPSFLRPPPPPAPAQEEHDEDNVGFQKAREMLVKRSKKNGNDVAVLSKVNRRKTMFEQLEKDNRRKTMPHGRLKTTWVPKEDSAKTSSNYKKQYAPDICPKKSVNDLP